MAGTRVGYIGAGQLARMSIAPAIALGIELRLLARTFDESAAQANVQTQIGSPDNQADVAAIASVCDVTTFDHELVDVGNLNVLESQGMRFAPGPHVLRVSQSKRLQRELFASLGLRGPNFCVGATAWSKHEVERQFSYPLVIKADRGGYDGRGVWIVDNSAALEQVLEALRTAHLEPIVEDMVTIDREVAIIIARSTTGEMRTFPLVETVQIDGMLAELVAPAIGPDMLQARADEIARTIAEGLDVTGLLAVELFEAGGSLLVNEIGTRPHNSGHYTIEGCTTSQFEQHLRAVLGWPLGSTEMARPYAATCNLVAGDLPVRGEDVISGLADPDVHVHWYQKEFRPGRKLGHVTVVGDDRDQVVQAARKAANRICRKDDVR